MPKKTEHPTAQSGTPPASNHSSHNSGIEDPEQLKFSPVPEYVSRVLTAEEDSRAEKTGKSQSENELFNILYQISNKVSYTNDPEMVFTILGDELRSHDLDCMVIFLDEKEQTAHIAYHTMSPDVLKTAEKFFNAKFTTENKPLYEWAAQLHPVFVEGDSLYLTDFNEIVTTFIPLPKTLALSALTVLGITSGTRGAFLPMQTQGKNLGSLSIWGKEFKESDLEICRLFSSQIASAIEHARLQAAKERQNLLLTRSNSLIKTLDNVSLQISSADNADTILNILGTELNKLGLQCLVTFKDQEANTATIRYLSYGPKLIKKIQSAINTRVIGYRISLSGESDWMAQFLQQRDPVFFHNITDMLYDSFPHIPAQLFKKMLELLNISKGTSGIILSLDYQNSIIGSLIIWGDFLNEDDIPAYSVFASQVANIIEYARLLNTAREENRIRKETQKKLEKSRQELRGIFELAHDAILLIDPENRMIIDVNDRASDIYRFTREEFRGMDLADLNPDLRIAEWLIDRTVTDGHCNGCHVIHFQKSGEEMKLEFNSSLIEFNDKPVIQCIGRDITERDKYENMLKHAANHDALTNLPNRVMFKNRLKYAIARSKRYKEVGFSVLYIDLDDFKRINDSLGHPSGDRYLIEFSKKLVQIIRETDLVARLGGDEFAVLLEDTHQSEDAVHFCNRLMHSLIEPIRIDDQEFVVTASIGIVMSSPEITSADSYLRNADIAMYKAKKNGKRCYSIYSDGMHTGLLQKVHMETRIRRAMQLNEFFLEYQPIINVTQNQIQGYEALIRWQPPDSSVIPPASFIPVAEEIGLIHKLGKWVLQEACNQIQTWKHQKTIHPDSTISVNVSAIQLSHPQFPEEVRKILNDTGLEPEYLSLEITESAFVTDPFITETTLQAIRDLNVHIHLDDFGTGYSSLSFLAKFPINAIKIDKRFVMEIQQGNNLALVKSMLVLSQALGIEIIAEGVETQNQLQALINMGCQNMQGFYFSKPLAASKVSGFSYPTPE
ncbi:MAG: EAL domain-containing protein [Anaerolineales bacterium]|nr:EAL domain-containing protein [Anaerolineales bacterium]